MGYVLVEPTSLMFAAGETKRYTVTFTSNAAAEFGEATAGALTWSNGTTNVRSPIVVKPVAIAAPGEVSGNSTPRSYDIVFGFAGPFAVAERGLVPAAKQSDSVADDPTNTFVVGGPGVKAHTVTVPAGVKLAGFSLFNEEITPAGSHDLDLYVYKGDTEVGVSAGSTSNERVDLADPEARDYTVYVHGWQTAGGGTANYTLFSWQLGSVDAGNMTATPSTSTATIAGSATENLTFSGLAPATRYLGAVDYKKGADTVGSTIVSIKTP